METLPTVLPVVHHELAFANAVNNLQREGEIDRLLYRFVLSTLLTLE